MHWRRSLLLASLALAPLSLAACGHSEEEWQAKLRESRNLTDSLAQERDAHKKSEGELDDSRAQIEQLKQQLSKTGVDLSNLNAEAREQRLALDKLRKDKEQLDEIRKRFDMLKQKLETLTKLGLSVTVRNNRMMIQLPGDVLFDSGKVDLKPEGQTILTKIAEVIRNDAQLVKRTFQVAGHTDGKVLTGGPFKDNWGLSVMRAREVLTFLVAPVETKKPGGGLPAEKWSASGYGETDPVAPNDSPEQMKRNRRVELVVVPNVEEMLDLKSLTK